MNEQFGLKRTPNVLIAAGAAMVVMLGGCTTGPTKNTSTLSMKDPKWQSPEVPGDSRGGRKLQGKKD
jgi:hypothetical protein